jgi:hypothetical protein
VGKLFGLNTDFRGGAFALADAGGAVSIASGTVVADQLSIDTRDRITPVFGTIDLLKDVVIEGQTLAFDTDTSVGAASVKINAKKMDFVKGDGYPSGTLQLQGSVTKVSGGAFGAFHFSSADIRQATLARKPRAAVEITDGIIAGHMNISGGTAQGTVNVLIRDLEYYSDKHGSASLDFDVPDVQYEVTIEGRRYPDDPDAYPLVELKTVKVPLALTEPLSVSRQLKAVDGKWRTTQPIDLDFKLRTHIKQQELIYARAKVLTGQCVEKLMFSENDYALAGKLHINLDENNPFHLDTMSLSSPIAFFFDGTCDDLADFVCGIAGGTIMGPIGTLGAVILCDREISKKEKELVDRINDEIFKKVKALQFHS